LHKSSPSLLLLDFGEIYMATNIRESNHIRPFTTMEEGREWVGVLHEWNRITIESHQTVHDQGGGKSGWAYFTNGIESQSNYI
jgi:hypothetical protein